MTMAVCFKCGEMKVGAFSPCPNCRSKPLSDRNMAVSYLLTEHYFSPVDLKRISRETKAGRPPVFEEEDVEKVAAVIKNLNKDSKAFQKLQEHRGQ